MEIQETKSNPTIFVEEQYRRTLDLLKKKKKFDTLWSWHKEKYIEQLYRIVRPIRNP